MADFQSDVLVFGVDGLNLQNSLDKLKPTELSRMINLVRAELGGVTGRPGDVAVAGATLAKGQLPGIEFLAIARLNTDFDAAYPGAAPQSLTPTGIRFVQVGASLYLNGGPLGDELQQVRGVTLDPTRPATMIAYRPPLSSQAWLYIASLAGMFKVLPPVDVIGEATVTPWGLPAPLNPDLEGRLDEWDWDLDTTDISDKDGIALLTIDLDFSPGSEGELFELAPPHRTTIDSCDTAGWTDQAGTGGAPSNATDNVDFKEGTGSLKLTTAPGTATGAYWNAWAKANVLNLSQLSSNAKPATDDDLMHLWAQADRPDQLLELRLYFVLSNFEPAALPGASAGKNDNAYVKTFYPRAFAQFIEGTTPQTSAQAAENTTGQTIDQGGGAGTAATIPPFGLGRQSWTEFGIVDRTLKRGEFIRIGSDPTLDWKDVKGLCISALTNTNQVVNIWVDDIYLYGGAGPDSTFPGNQKYNYRYRHYDPRTGAKGNPCPISPEEVWLDAARQGFVIHPKPYGLDPEIRQQIFRQGGSLVQFWYYVGINGSDGGEFTDLLGDDEIINAEILHEDNDQPVKTKSFKGEEVLAQPLPVVFGPFDEVFFGLGDPYAPGTVYWCKPTELDHWPARNSLEVLGTAVRLVAGCAFQGQPFIFGRNGPMLALYPSLASTGSVRYVPTGCGRGPVSASALVSGRRGMFFVANDGIYNTQGGAEQSLTDDTLWPLFHMAPGVSRNGYFAVDFSEPDAIRLALHQDDLWFIYRDVQGVNQCLIYSLAFNYWRPYRFEAQVSCVFSEPTDQASLIMGHRSAGFLGQHSGSGDYDGTEEQPIPVSGRTGATDQQNPRRDKVYGDVWLDVNPKSVNVTIKTLVDYENEDLGDEVITGAVRDQFRVHPYTPAPGTPAQFGEDGTRIANNTSIDFSWETDREPPVIFEGGASFIIQPETTQKRVTDWSDEGRLTDKMIKGIVLEVDTGGNAKTFEIQGDGVTQATITVQASGRKSLEFTWVQFRARIIRIKPTDSAAMILYSHRWIFDEEPLAVARWETQERDEGIQGWAAAFWSFITIACFDNVTLTILCYDQNGNVFNTVTNVIASTAGAKQKLFVPFVANKSVLRKYTLTSPAAFYLYREETYVELQPLEGGEIRKVQIFGNDDLDRIRAMHDAGLGAARSGGGGG